MWFKRKLTRKILFKETAKAIDKKLKVIYSKDDNRWCDITKGIIQVPKEINDDLYTYLQHYMLIDMGFKYYNYCSYDVFAFLHEIGHYINGYIDIQGWLIVSSLTNFTELSHYEKVKSYIGCVDEYLAWDFAYEFCKKNKAYVKRLSKELENAV